MINWQEIGQQIETHYNRRNLNAATELYDQACQLRWRPDKIHGTNDFQHTKEFNKHILPWKKKLTRALHKRAAPK